jgi:hypothetical protein
LDALLTFMAATAAKSAALPVISIDLARQSVTIATN